MSGLFAAEMPHSFRQLEDYAEESAEQVAVQAANLAHLTPRLAENMRRGLRCLRGVRPQVADSVAGEFVTRNTRILNLLNELKGELKSLGELANEHRETFRGVEIDERRAAHSSAFRP